MRSSKLYYCSAPGDYWAFRVVFLGGSPTLIWPWEGFSHPSRSCNGSNGPKGPKLKNKKQTNKLTGEPIPIWPGGPPVYGSTRVVSFLADDVHQSRITEGVGG